MKISEVLRRADDLRPNTIGDEQKAAWVQDLDAQLSEMMGVPMPEYTWPTDRVLLMGAPHEEIYQLYLCAKIDYYNNEPSMYANDLAMFNSALDQALAWYRRNNMPPYRGNWRVM